MCDCNAPHVAGVANNTTTMVGLISRGDITGYHKPLGGAADALSPGLTDSRTVLYLKP